MGLGSQVLVLWSDHRDRLLLQGNDRVRRGRGRGQSRERSGCGRLHGRLRIQLCLHANPSRDPSGPAGDQVIAASQRTSVGGRGAATPATRLLEALLLLLLVVGAFALWVGVPATVLWALGKATTDPTEHLILGLIAVPVGMVLFGLVLVVINTAFLRVSGDSFAAADDASGWKPSLRGPPRPDCRDLGAHLPRRLSRLAAV